MADVLWYYAQDDEQKGPVSGAELRELASSGKLAGDDLIWREGMAEWVPAQKVKGLFPDGKATKTAAAPTAQTTAVAAPRAPGAVAAPPVATITAPPVPAERSVGPDFSEIESFTSPPEPVDEVAPPAAPEVAKPRRGARQHDSTPSVAHRKSHAHHGHAHATDGSGLLKGIQALLWIACSFVVLVGGVLLTRAMLKSQDSAELAAEGATYAAFFIGAYIVARAGEKLADLLRGK